MFGIRKFLKGLLIVPKTTSEVSAAGEIDFDTTSNRLNLHDGSTASPLVGETHAAQGSHRLKNKDLEDSSTSIVDASDTTKKIKFDAAGTTGTSTTLLGSQTTDKTLTLPDATDTLVGKNTTDTLTNKSISGSSNTFSNIPNSATTATDAATASTIASRDSSANTSFNKVKVATGAGNGLDVPAAGALEIGASVGANNITVGGSSSTVVIPGNVQVNGTTTNVNSTNMVVTDKNITINNGGNDASSEGAGLTVDRTSTDGSIIYKDASATKFAVGPVGSEVDIVGISSTQTLTNKTLTGNTAVNLISGSGTLTLNTSGTITVPNGTDTLVGKNTTDTLTNKTLTTPATDIVTWDDQASTPSNPSSGFYKTYFKTNGKLYKLDSGGTETEIGAGAGGINYISNSSAEADTSGWATYADAAGSTPVDGTGGSPTLTFTRSTSSPLRGSASFLVTKDAANRQGNGASYDFTIDSADKAKILQVTADYAIASGTYADGDLTVYIYDVTNSLVIQPAGYVINKLTQDLPGKLNATFQTASNSTSYRLIIHCASTSASAYTVKLDNVSVGPQVVEYGAPVTDWVDNTSQWTISSGFGTSTTNTKIYQRRVGDSLEVQLAWTNGSSPSGNGYIQLPSGLTIDTSKIPTNGSGAVVGAAVEVITGTSRGVYSNDDAHVWFFDGSINNQIFYANAEGSSVLTKTVASASRPVTGYFKIPITGWSSSVVMSNDTDTRVVSFNGTKSSTQAVTANVTDITFVSAKDSHSGWGGSSFTVPVPGDYVISALLANNAAAAANFFVFINGSSYRLLLTGLPSGDLGGGSTLLSGLKAGDSVSIRSNSSITVAAAGNLSIYRLSGPSAIAASETVAARYYSSSTSVSGTPAALTYATKDYDTHGAYSGSTFTCPISGKYQVNAGVIMTATFSGTTPVLVYIYKNGSQIAQGRDVPSSVATSAWTSVSDVISCNAGDTIQIYGACTGTGPAISADNALNKVSIVRVGN